jgi:inhibitor of the kinA pathway to sporulation, predicted exonuclease
MSIFIDLEMNTTDTRLVRRKKLKNEVIEIGAVRMDDAFHPLDRFRIFVRPQYNGVIERKIYKLTGISNGAVSDAVSLPEALDALEAWCGSDGYEIYAWSTSDLCQLRKECGFKGIDSVFLDEMVQWHDFQEDFRQMLGEKNILSLSNAMHRAGLEPEGSLHDASWDAYNSARLMETAYSEDFAVDLANAQDACYQEAPKIQGGLPLDMMMKLAALLQPEPCAAV